VSDSGQLTLIAAAADVVRHERPLPDGFTLRPMSREDERPLADLYLAAYHRTHVDGLNDAKLEMRITFDGEHGELDLDASPVILTDDRIVAAVMTVEAAPWPGSPPGPFVIEVMTDPEFRRRGLAQAALCAAARSVLAIERSTLALFVGGTNAGARALYDGLGFRRWP
jgi:ribosomal protein S18 acetylase RimI-like enzyme